MCIRDRCLGVIENVIYRIGGATTHQFDITGYYADVQPEDRILRIPIGELGLNNWLTSDGYTGASSNRPINQSEWVLELNTAGSVFDTITVIKSVSLNTLSIPFSISIVMVLGILSTSTKRVKITLVSLRNALESL